MLAEVLYYQMQLLILIMY